MRISVLRLVSVLLALSSLGTAQAPGTIESGTFIALALPPPVLTDVQKLTFHFHLKDMAVAQLKAQAAQRDFDLAVAEVQKLVSALTVKGYTLTLQPCCAYEKVADLVPPPEPKP